MWHYLHAKSRHTLHILLIEMCLAFILALSQRHIQRLWDQDAAIHLGHSLRCFFRWTEAHEAESLRSTAFVHHLLTQTRQPLWSHILNYRLSSMSTSLTSFNKLFLWSTIQHLKALTVHQPFVSRLIIIIHIWSSSCITQNGSFWFMCLKANSAFHPSGVGKWVPASAGKAKAGMVHSVSGWTWGVQEKLWNPLRTCAIAERLRGVFTTRRYTNPCLPYLMCRCTIK